MKILKRLFILLILLGSLCVFGCSLLPIDDPKPIDDPVANPTDDPAKGPEEDLPPTKLEILNKVSELKVGEEIILEVKVSPDEAKNKEVKYSSSDESIAIVDNGKIKALKAGTVTIRVSSEAVESVKDEFIITIIDPQSDPTYNLIKDLKDKDQATISGTVCGVNKESFLIDDSTGIILVYLGNTWKCDVEIGDILEVSGTITTYGKALQFGRGTTYTKYASSEYYYSEVKKPSGNELDNYLSKTTISPTYVELSGVLSQSGNYFNIALNGANTAIGSLSYPMDASSLANFIGKEIVVEGFITGVSSNKYINILYTSVGLKENDYLTSTEYELAYRDYIYSVLGNDIVIYSNDDINPYGIDLDIYGDDIYAVFYEYDLDSAIDPYTSINKTDFYNSYTEANSYIDSYFRTLHGLMSGDITPQGHLPNKLNITENGRYIKCSTAFYVLSTSGGYIGYLPNDFYGNFQMIWYGGAYTSLNEVSAYLLAFGEVPPNSNYDKSSGKGQCIIDFGIYGRVNKDVMQYDNSKWPYEPELPGIMLFEYTETDVGTIGGYTSENKITGTKYTQKNYNTGTTINRGAARLCFISDKNFTKINDRRVFYTYNHYNDFEEYLNYNNGFGVRFGNETSGNEYCGSASDYYQSAKNPPTQYEYVLVYSISEILK